MFEFHFKNEFSISEIRAHKGEGRFVEKHCLQWRLVMKEEDQCFHLECHQKEIGPPWSILVDFCPRAENNNNTISSQSAKDYVLSSGSKENESGSSCEHILVILNFLETRGDMSYFNENKKITINCFVNVKKVSGLWLPRTELLVGVRDFSYPRGALTDAVLLVGGVRKFHVSKNMLANLSDYFKGLFYNGHFRETDLSIVDLRGVHPDIFQLFLDFLYHEISIREENVEALLAICDYFGSEALKKNCVNALMTENFPNIGTETKLALSEQFLIPELTEKCLELLKPKPAPPPKIIIPRKKSIFAKAWNIFVDFLPL